MEKYQILIRNRSLSLVVEDWMEKAECDIRLRKAKTPGCRVVELTDPVYAARMIKWLRVAEKVNIAKLRMKSEELKIKNYEEREDLH